MKIEILVFKDTGKYYTSDIVESDKDIAIFDSKFKLFIKNHIPANIGDGYIVVKDLEDVDYKNQSFHNALYKYNEIFN